MIIDRIALTNFGLFCGRHEIVLTPPDPRKPIILIGGQNGGGKTTLLDSLQLAFYGPQGRCAGRGKLGYKDYLREMIHWGVAPAEGASVEVHFRRITEGKTRNVSITRSWSDNGKGLEEFVEVVCDKVRDQVLSEHWGEYIENYLPVRLASLFFFDGEQIASMAEDEHAAGMLETALHSLLGLDLVERLKNDLVVLNRRKTEAQAPDDVRDQLALLDGEVKEAELRVEKAVQEQARVKGVVVHLRDSELIELKRKFSKDGGDLFLKREDLEEEQKETRAELTGWENELRDLAAGPAPFLLVEGLLKKVEKQAGLEIEAQEIRILGEAEVERDRKVLECLRRRKLGADALEVVKTALETHQHKQVDSSLDIYLDPPPEFPEELRRLREVDLPQTREKIVALFARVRDARERLAGLDGQLAAVPAADAVGKLQRQIQEVEKRIHDVELEVRMADETRRQCEVTLVQRQRAWKHLFDQTADSRETVADDGRILVRIPKIQSTLEEFGKRVVAKHLGNFERLILESFQCLLRKDHLVTGLAIDPKDFRITLISGKGQPLPFLRLSAGERQLLAASILWGMAKASGRPVPTFIDTPLGRLDSSHRTHLVERYFPNASHQVVLLSTDEEITGKYFSLLRPYIGRTYRLESREAGHETVLTEGYFQHDEVAN